MISNIHLNRSIPVAFLVLGGLVLGIVPPAFGFAGGSGTQADPYQITTWNHLNDIRNNTSSYFVVNNDIDSTTAGYATHASDTANSGNGWAPIESFNGSLDGNFHTIEDLRMNVAGGDVRDGFFGNINDGGTVANLGLTNVDIDIAAAGDFIGGLVGRNRSVVQNCFVTGSIQGSGKGVGLLAGKNHGPSGETSRIVASFSSGTVNGKQTLGGLVGVNRRGQISASYSTAHVVQSADTDAGGLVGEANIEGNGGISRSYAVGLVDDRSPDPEVGGLIGLYLSGTFTSDYYDTYTTRQSDPTGDTKGIGLPTSRMAGAAASTHMSEFAIDGASDTWDVHTRSDPQHVTYPYLAWQTARFPRADTQIVDTSVVNPSLGSVTKSIAFDTYLAGETVTLSALPDSNVQFAGWSVAPDRGSIGDTRLKSTVYTVGDTDVTITATFHEIFTGTVADQSDVEDTDPWTISLDPLSSDTISRPLKWTVSGDTSVVDVSLTNNAYNDGGVDTMTISPLSGATGTDTLTLKLGDAVDTATQSFTVTLTSNKPLIDLEKQRLPRADTPLTANGVDTRSVTLTVENTGYDGTLLVDTGDLRFLDDSGNTAGFSKQLRTDTSIAVPESTQKTLTWWVTAPDTNRTSLFGDFTPSFDETTMTVLNYRDTDVGSPDNALSADPPTLKIAGIAGVVKNAAVGVDTTVGSMKNVTFDGGVANGESVVDTSVLSDGDSIWLYVEHGDSTALDTPITSPAYSFADRQDFLNTIETADSAYEGEDTSIVSGELMSITLWKNTVGPSSNYLGDSATLEEPVDVSVGNVSFNESADLLKVVKLVPGASSWTVVDSNPAVTGSAGNYTVSFTVRADTSVRGAGFSVFRVISTGVGTTTDAGAAIVYPDPFVPTDGDPSTGQYCGGACGTGEGIHWGTAAGDGFPAGTTVTIYNVVGERIDRFRSSTGGLIQWNAETRNGDKVASGVYFYVIDVAGGSNKTGKFSIVR